MKTVIAIARNIRYLWNDEEKKTEAEIEAVLTTYDNERELREGQIVRLRKFKTLRFPLTVESAREFSKQLNEWAEFAERHCPLIQNCSD